MNGDASPAEANAESDAAKRRPSDDEARDSLHILPLSSIPLETPGLQHARLIKNVRLQTVVEMFRDTQTGSSNADDNYGLWDMLGQPKEVITDFLTQWFKDHPQNSTGPTNPGNPGTPRARSR